MDPSIDHTIVTSLSSWRQDGTVPLHLIPQSLHSVVHQQTLIGWRALLEGAAATQWWHAQQDYCLQHCIAQSNRQWLRNTLVQLVRLGRAQWLHRNEEKHVISQPRHRRADAYLQRAIILWLYT